MPRFEHRLANRKPNSMSKSRQDRIDFDRNYCAHYKPVPGSMAQDYCALKCDASERMAVAREAGEPRMTPCIGGHTTPNVLTLCPKWERRSLEHAEKRADSIEKHMKMFEIVMPVVNKWRTWTDQNRVAKQEVIECPACKGRLHLSQAAYNGHVHGHCKTEGCVSWME